MSLKYSLKLKVLVAQLHLALYNSMYCILLSSSVQGILQTECWSELPFSSPGDPPDPGIELRPPALQADCLLSEPPGKPPYSTDPMFKLHQNPVDLKQAQMCSLVTLALYSTILSSQAQQGISPHSILGDKCHDRMFSPWLIPYQMLLLICITGFSDRSGKVERRISHLFTERRQRLREAWLLLPSWSMEEQQAEPFSSGSWCRALLGTLVAKQTREHPLKLQRLEPAGPELDPPHQCATSVSFL